MQRYATALEQRHNKAMRLRMHDLPQSGSERKAMAIYSLAKAMLGWRKHVSIERIFSHVNRNMWQAFTQQEAKKVANAVFDRYPHAVEVDISLTPACQPLVAVSMPKTNLCLVQLMPDTFRVLESDEYLAHVTFSCQRQQGCPTFTVARLKLSG